MVHATPRHRVHAIRGTRHRNGVPLPLDLDHRCGRHCVLISQTASPLQRAARVRRSHRVDDLHAFIAQLEADGISTEKVEEFDYGRFAWVRDPDNIASSLRASRPDGRMKCPRVAAKIRRRCLLAPIPPSQGLGECPMSPKRSTGRHSS